jgi:hypothetical protein
VVPAEVSGWHNGEKGCPVGWPRLLISLATPRKGVPRPWLFSRAGGGMFAQWNQRLTERITNDRHRVAQFGLPGLRTRTRLLHHGERAQPIGLRFLWGLSGIASVPATNLSTGERRPGPVQNSMSTAFRHSRWGRGHFAVAVQHPLRSLPGLELSGRNSHLWRSSKQ